LQLLIFDNRHGALQLSNRQLRTIDLSAVLETISMTLQFPSALTLKKLAQYDTPTICNIIELFEIRPNTAGYMDSRIRAAFPEMPPMVGFAATATFRSASPPSKSTYVSLDSQVELFAKSPGPVVVVFQDLDDPSVGATFGEVMCSTYKAFGSVGLITSGGGRDLLQVKALAYPVFSGSTICSHAYCQTLDVGAPVRVGGLAVQTGDLLHGDANGVTNIPLEIASEVSDVADEFLAAEDHILQYVKGSSTKEIGELTAKRAAAGEAMAAIRRRVSRKKSC
jgi:regulator of RNase E activity RraA